MLPWPAGSLILLAGGCAGALARWLRRRRRGFAAFTAMEVVLFSGVLDVTLTDRLFGGLAPYAPTLAPGGGSARRPRRCWSAGRGWSAGGSTATPGWSAGRLRGAGLRRGVVLWRSRRDRLAIALPDQIHVEVVAGFLAGLCALQLIVVSFLAPQLHGAWAPARLLLPVVPIGAALAGWGLRHAPRVGAALAALTLGATAWMLIGLRVGERRPAAGQRLRAVGRPAEAPAALRGPDRPLRGGRVAACGIALAAVAVREWRAWHAARDGVPTARFEFRPSASARRRSR